MAKVLLEREGPVAWLRMNRPEAHNAFSKEMTGLMADRVRQLSVDRDVRAAILCGNGPSFSTGVDVKELVVGEMDAEGFVAWNRMARDLRELTIPLIVAIHGNCLGGGTMLTLVGDYRHTTRSERSLDSDTSVPPATTILDGLIATDATAARGRPPSPTTRGAAETRRVAGAVARPGSHRTVLVLFTHGSSGRRVANPAAGQFIDLDLSPLQR